MDYLLYVDDCLFIVMGYVSLDLMPKDILDVDYVL